MGRKVMREKMGKLELLELYPTIRTTAIDILIRQIGYMVAKIK